MNLYLISRKKESFLWCDYDTYYGAVVAAQSKYEAADIHPSGDQKEWQYRGGSWVDTSMDVDIVLLGVAVNIDKAGVVLASFNAGKL